MGTALGLLPERFDPLGRARSRGGETRLCPYTCIARALSAAPGTWKEMVPGAPEFADPEKRAAAERVVAHTARIGLSEAVGEVLEKLQLLHHG